MTLQTIQLILLLACLAGSALFSGTEIALIATDRFRLRSLAQERHAAVELSFDLLNRRDKILATLLVGGTLANTAAASLATGIVENYYDPPISTIGTTVVLTIVILVIGEISPKSFARTRAESVLMAASRPLFALDLLFLPVTAVMGGLVNLIIGALGGKTKSIITREDLRILVQDVRGATGSSHHEKRMLQSILDFRHTTTREVMVPMPSVVSVERESSDDMLRTILKRHGYTRIPVYERRVDRVIGVVHAFDVLLNPEAGKTMEDYMRPITLVPETKPIDRLMVEMQGRGESMVVIVNEFGSCAGIVTMEDIVEEIMGELADDHEVGVKRIRSLGEGSYIVDALTDIDDLNEELGCELPKLRYDTVGGLVMGRLGRIPQEGDRCSLMGIEFEVVEAYPYGVRTVKLTFQPQSEERR